MERYPESPYYIATNLYECPSMLRFSKQKNVTFLVKPGINQVHAELPKNKTLHTETQMKQ